MSLEVSSIDVNLWLWTSSALVIVHNVFKTILLSGFLIRGLERDTFYFSVLNKL
jgi:hypothetical protein